MKAVKFLSIVLLLVFSTVTIAAGDAIYKPFVVASVTSDTLAKRTGVTLEALRGAGFEVAGQYTPFAGTNIIVVTSGELQKIAAMSDRGGYAAGQRVSISEAGDRIEVAFINPVYIQYAYRLNGDMQGVYDALKSALGVDSMCGAGNKKMTAKKLGRYHYMIGMQRFDDPSELGTFESHDAAVDAVEGGLAKPGDPLTQVYRIDIPGTQQTVIGVGMKMTEASNEDLDEAFQMNVVDFEGCKKRAYLPYEVLVNGNDVEALHMRFRMALYFPNLSMMGKHGFTKLISAPRMIEKTLEKMVQGDG